MAEAVGAVAEQPDGAVHAFEADVRAFRAMDGKWVSSTQAGQLADGYAHSHRTSHAYQTLTSDPSPQGEPWAGLTRQALIIPRPGGRSGVANGLTPGAVLEQSRLGRRALSSGVRDC